MKRTTASKGRGYFGIGIERSKTEANVGTLWRSAFCLGASFIFTIGRRYPHQSTDVTQAWRHIPLLEYADVADFAEHRPYDCQVIGVELTADASALETFGHPQRAIYLLGPEDGSLSGAALALCQTVVRFDSTYCLNVAAAGTVVMYDRQAKAVRPTHSEAPASPSGDAGPGLRGAPASSPSTVRSHPATAGHESRPAANPQTPVRSGSRLGDLPLQPGFGS